MFFFDVASPRFVALGSAPAHNAPIMSDREVGLRMPWIVLAGVLLARPVSAEPVDLVVDCRGLSAELRASLEARLRAGLSLKRLERWHLRVACDGRTAAVEFTAEGGVVSRREAALAGEPEDWVDRVLELVHDAAAVPERTEPTTSAQLPVVPEPPEAAPPRAGPAARPVAPPVVVATPVEAAPPRASPIAPRTLRIEPEASLSAEAWLAEPLVLVGPAASVGLWFERRFRLVPTVAAAWSAGSGQDVAVRSLEGGLDAAVGAGWWFALGARVAWLRFDPRAALSPASKTVVDPALVARVGLSTPVGSSRLSLSLGGRAYAWRRDVRIDGTVALRIPSVAAVALIGYSSEPL
jgi:hypothetical protein